MGVKQHLTERLTQLAVKTIAIGSWSTTEIRGSCEVLDYCAMELNKEITCERQNQSFLFNKYTSKALYQTLQTAKMNFEKLLG